MDAERAKAHTELPQNDWEVTSAPKRTSQAAGNQKQTEFFSLQRQCEKSLGRSAASQEWERER